jgi:hypothetical protein
MNKKMATSNNLTNTEKTLNFKSGFFSQGINNPFLCSNSKNCIRINANQDKENCGFLKIQRYFLLRVANNNTKPNNSFSRKEVIQVI